ncbi:photosystem I reaction center subunit N, chloroplastic-like [Macadamia integrifolia]|uniref:photosystem I reaction center subunit N, chloroplastic-like n=1 Tax=Macadamia integrifolia TaxID=60698 RepID=UPI001C4F69D7|nr:photosystem I reaction center subunit N, chloroplastic-like [Macadamia integrifolia]
MATMNSSVLSCNYAISGTASSDVNWKLTSMPSVASSAVSSPKLPAIKAHHAKVSVSKEAIRASEGRRAALVCLAAALFASATSSSSANAGVIEEYLEKSKANKELNDKKRLATSGANFARAYTVEFGSCKFPENFTGCQDLAKQKKVPFLSEDIELECKGKDKYKCGSNVFWKW